MPLFAGQQAAVDGRRCAQLLNSNSCVDYGCCFPGSSHHAFLPSRLAVPIDGRDLIMELEDWACLASHGGITPVLLADCIFCTREFLEI